MEPNFQTKKIYSYFYSEKESTRKCINEFNYFKYWIDNNLIHLLNLYQIFLQINDTINITHTKFNKETEQNIQSDNNKPQNINKYINKTFKKNKKYQRETKLHRLPIQTINNTYIITKKKNIQNISYPLIDLLDKQFIYFSYHIFTFNFNPINFTKIKSNTFQLTNRSKDLVNILNNILDEFTITGH